MSEKLGNSFEEFEGAEDNGASSLEEMADQFDPDKAEAERQKETEKVLFKGEASKLTESEKGGVGLESKYRDAWFKYRDGENYDENDGELSHAIWDVGMGAALLDVSEDVANEIRNGDGNLYEAMKDDRVLNIFDKACEDMEKIANSSNKAAAEEATEFIKSTGKVGEFIVKEYKEWQEDKAAFGELTLETIKEETKKPDEKEYLDRLDTLEKRLSKMESSKRYNTEEIEELAASYKELQRKIHDPETREKVEDRYNYLSDLTHRFENIQSIINKM